MKKVLLICALCMTFGLSADALGQRRDNDGRNDIRRGVRTGQLTRDEARQLRQNRRQIRQERRAYRSDGTLTRDERRDDDRRRGNGYYRRGAGSPSHPVFGRRNRRNRY